MVFLGKIYVGLDQELNDGLGGTITSANFPENYDHNTDCSFTILPVPGNHVTLQVTTLYKSTVPNIGVLWAMLQFNSSKI